MALREQLVALLEGLGEETDITDKHLEEYGILPKQTPPAPEPVLDPQPVIPPDAKADTPITMTAAEFMRMAETLTQSKKVDLPKDTEETNYAEIYLD